MGNDEEECEGGGIRAGKAYRFVSVEHTRNREWRGAASDGGNGTGHHREDSSHVTAGRVNARARDWH